jgi:signal peptidase II
VPSRRLARRLNGGVALIALAVTLLDAATKAWARHALGGGARHLLGPLDLRLAYNSGVSFSFGGGAPGALALVSAVVAAGVVVVGAVAAPGAPTLGFGLMIGGGVANLIDRLAAHPHRVTDFVAVSSLPVFNLADLAITAGFVVLVAQALAGRRLVER